jgi:choline kinase
MQGPVRRAVILAAGNGDRFRTPTRESKLLQPLLGRPILLRTIEAARDAGVQAITVVLGYQADRVRALVEGGAPRGIAMSFAYNPDWQLENGVSALAARSQAGRGRFALLMGDHVFEPPVLQRMLRLSAGADDSLLAVDAGPATPEQAAEATKVRRVGSRIVAIGKDLVEYDALDTGVFVCSPVLFDALEQSCAQGDTTLSGGIRQLAARGLMHGVEIGGAAWCDIDTRADLDAAEALLGAESGVA